MQVVSFGQRLRQLRIEHSKSMREAAREADISVTYLSKLETDEGNPTLEVLNKLAELYGVSVQELTLGSGATQDKVQLEPSLEEFIARYKNTFPELNEPDWKIMLNNIRLRGLHPKISEDWLHIFVDIRRALNTKKEW
jgi:transcriptional regulator with XRE-family HTH domain